ncbi:MAG: hypothetical protein KGH76_02930 [Thaumarchaeota archaeon]|nr:hypothetical protein [Nitrososphaerota archaeon]
MERYEINLFVTKKPTDVEIRKIQEFFIEMPPSEIISGLNFAHRRWTAKDAGVLKVGRKSIIHKEIHSVTVEQAHWRLKNWKMMIANYRKMGYSYPTISRIKKHFVELSKKRSR